MYIAENTALIVIDVQEGLDSPVLGQRNNPDAEANIARLLATWRAQGRPVFHTRHLSTQSDSPLRPEQPGSAIKASAKPLPNEVVIDKQVNSAFIGTDLEARLRAANITDLVFVGLTTNHCVSTSVRMASNLGFTTMVVADATAAHERYGPDGAHYSADTVHAVELATLHGEFGRVVLTRELIAASS